MTYTERPTHGTARDAGEHHDPAGFQRQLLAALLDFSDGNFAVRTFDLRLPRADLVVWLDLPRRTVMRQLIARTLRRAVTREKLWNGNREPLANLMSLDPEKSIIVWAWVKHDEFARRYLDAMTDPTWQNITFVRLRSPVEAKRWLESI